MQRLMAKVGYMVGYVLYREGGKRELGHGRFGDIARPTTGDREC